MPYGNEALFISLLVLSLIRFTGLVVSLDFFIRTRKQKHFLFIIAWLLGCAGPILGILTLYPYSAAGFNYLWILFSLFAGLSTILIVFGALSYFKKIKVKYIIMNIFAFVIAAILLKLFLKLDIASSFTILVQAGFLVFLIFAIILQRKLFLRLARVSYYWLIGTAGIGIIHSLGFIFIYKEQSIAFVGTSFLAGFTIIFILHLENDLSLGKLKESENYKNTLFEKSPIGLALAAMDGKLIDVNTAYLTILGRSREETLNLSFWDITPEKYSEMERQKIKSLKTTGNYTSYEKEYIHKDGHLITVRLKCLLIQRNGKDYNLASVEDISHQKQVQEELDKYREHLEELVEDKTRELEKKTSSLEESQKTLILLLKDVNEVRAELEFKNADLKEFNDLFIEREFRIKELKDRIKELEGKNKV